MSYKGTYPEETAIPGGISMGFGTWRRIVWNLAAGAALVVLSSAAPAGAAQSHWRVWASPGPPPRSGYAMAYDRARQVTVLFGGRRGRVRGASATSLRVTVPRRAPRGTVDLYVVVGGVASNILGFIVR